MRDWFTVWTDPRDPTHIEMRRMSDHEIAAARQERAREMADLLMSPADRFAGLLEQAREFYAGIRSFSTSRPRRLSRREKRRARKRRRK